MTDQVRRGARPRVSVVVAHFEQPRQLARTLAGLRHQTYPAELLDVVVADDGSSMPPAVPAGVRVVRQEDEGFRAARVRNLGAAGSTGEVLVFLDADTTPEPDYLDQLVRRPALEPAAVVVGRRRHADLGALPDLSDAVDPRAWFDAARDVELTEPEWLRDGLDQPDELSFRFVMSSVLACGRAFFEELGGFDESFSTYGGEDWEWAHRAWTHGAVLTPEPRAVAWHDGPDRGARPGWGADADGRARLLAETLAVAGRVPVPGVAPRGLLLGPPDPLVTVAPELTGDALVIGLDSLVAALPRSRLLLTARQARPVAADPRVVVVDDVSDAAVRRHAAARSAWRWLHLHRAVDGPRDAWAEPGDRLRGPGAPGRVVVGDESGPLVTWRSLRALRRTSPRATLTLTSAQLVPVPDSTTLQARWGGWA